MGLYIARYTSPRYSPQGGGYPIPGSSSKRFGFSNISLIGKMPYGAKPLETAYPDPKKTPMSYWSPRNKPKAHCTAILIPTRSPRCLSIFSLIVLRRADVVSSYHSEHVVSDLFERFPNQPVSFLPKISSDPKLDRSFDDCKLQLELREFRAERQMLID